jgi:ferric-dicitrate binding protein FerR (iron transport regulator)
MADNPASSEGADEAMEGALRRVLRPPVSADALAQLRILAESEWRRAAAAHRHQRAWRRMGLGVAAAGVFAVCGWLASTQLVAPGIIGVIAGNASGGLVVEHLWPSRSALAVGTPLRTNLRIHAGGTSEVAINGGGRLLLKDGTTIVTTAAHEIELIQGAVYVDMDPSRSHGALGVRTSYGLITHVGTQFEVTKSDDGQLVRVREGVAQITGVANGTARAGEEVALDAKGVVSRRALSTSDATWGWVDAAPIVYEVEGRTLGQFLRQVARDTGRQLDFMNESARQVAERTILHGSVRGLSALDALHELLATTSLSAELLDGKIRVSAAAPRTVPTHSRHSS